MESRSLHRLWSAADHSHPRPQPTTAVGAGFSERARSLREMVQRAAPKPGFSRRSPPRLRPAGPLLGPRVLPGTALPRGSRLDSAAAEGGPSGKCVPREDPRHEQAGVGSSQPRRCALDSRNVPEACARWSSVLPPAGLLAEGKNRPGISRGWRFAHHSPPEREPIRGLARRQFEIVAVVREGNFDGQFGILVDAVGESFAALVVHLARFDVL